MKESNICALGQEGSSAINITQLTSYRSLKHSVSLVDYFVSTPSLQRRVASIQKQRVSGQNRNSNSVMILLLLERFTCDAPSVVYSYLWPNFSLLCCIWLLAWTRVTGRNTDLTEIYTHFRGSDQSKVHSVFPKSINIKDSPMHGNKTEHLHLILCFCVDEAKYLKVMLMTYGWAEIILPIIPLHFPMM